MTQPMSSDATGASVRLTGFTPVSYDFIGATVERFFGHPPGSFARPAVIPLASAASLFFLLRAMPDDEFPNGKWATVQHLESLIEGEVASYVAS